MYPGLLLSLTLASVVPSTTSSDTCYCCTQDYYFIYNFPTVFTQDYYFILHCLLFSPKTTTLSDTIYCFHPGLLHHLTLSTVFTQDYYFISTSLPGDLHSRAGGYCLSHNMKVVFKVVEARSRPVQEQEVATVRINSAVKPLATTLGPSQRRRQERRKRRRRKELEELEELATSSSPPLAREPRDRQLSLAKTSFSSGQTSSYRSYRPTCLLILLSAYAFWSV